MKRVDLNISELLLKENIEIDYTVKSSKKTHDGYIIYGYNDFAKVLAYCDNSSYIQMTQYSSGIKYDVLLGKRVSNPILKASILLKDEISLVIYDGLNPAVFSFPLRKTSINMIDDELQSILDLYGLENFDDEYNVIWSYLRSFLNMGIRIFYKNIGKSKTKVGEIKE